jgi:hypothetical protein
MVGIKSFMKKGESMKPQSAQRHTLCSLWFGFDKTGMKTGILNQ